MVDHCNKSCTHIQRVLKIKSILVLQGVSYFCNVEFDLIILQQIKDMALVYH